MFTSVYVCHYKECLSVLFHAIAILYSESILGFARSFAHPLSLPKPRLRDRISFSKGRQKKTAWRQRRH